jgi:hypothetical protein
MKLPLIIRRILGIIVLPLFPIVLFIGSTKHIFRDEIWATWSAWKKVYWSKEVEK